MTKKTPLPDVYDGLALVGLSAVEYGVCQWSTPAAWVLLGAALIAAAIWPDLRKGTR